MSGNAVTPQAHENCIMCGRDNPYSLGLLFYPVSENSVEAYFKGSNALQGYTGILHGGVISALLDSAMVHMLFHKGIRAVTAELNVKFHEGIDSRWELKVNSSLLSSRYALRKFFEVKNFRGEKNGVAGTVFVTLSLHE
ncbi:MAG: PaaI family thioesterase [Kiritimatiellae bacterium]|jgi:hypothetical protein|nr:PaaI family thioesterase [Kiritimatiellia bacterium]